MRIDIITIFPELFKNYLESSLLAKACRKGLLDIRVHQLRDFTNDRHQTVDDKPYGGGGGMVLMVEPLFKALKSLVKFKRENGKLKKVQKDVKIILFTPRGKQFNQKIAYQLSKYKRLIMICGRYEGIDERVAKYLADIELSVGPYDLMGGELPAMIVTEAVARLLPGVLGNKSLLKERITSQKGFFEYPQYTRPEVFEPVKGIKWKVPNVLLSGHHEKIIQWRKKYGKVIEK
jgi:tRNA (guanine37-N1)-methyltransferase